ncbi:MAG: pilX [Proteobacteria bacterium]|nr:pilX [Pseudomonadota bacterium]
MLKPSSFAHGAPRRRQSGVVLLVALIMLIAMTLAALALVRSVDTANIIAGNQSFQQAATHSGDRGIETAIAWVENNSALLLSDSAASGYAANGLTAAPAKPANESWDAYWTRLWNGRAVQLAVDAATGTSVAYVIDRMCAAAGSPTGGALCAESPIVGVARGNAEEAGEKQITAISQVYYRITARVQGPRNTVSYVQAVISK